MTREVLSYISAKRPRRVPWYHWIPLAVLALLLAGVAIYAWLHWNDPQFWDL